MASTSAPEFILNWHNDDMARRVARQQPVCWSDVFGNDHPVDLEIGIGNGSFMVPFLRDHADRNMIGIEIEVTYLRKADRSLLRQSLTNGRLLVGDAKLLAWRLFEPESIADIYVNYPDPWFKKRHAKRRLLNPEFLRLLATRMRGVLTVATDDAEYKDFVLSSITEAGCFERMFESGFVSHLPDYYETKYERKWKSEGKTSYYMKFRKIAQPAVDAEEYARTQHLQFALNKISERTGTSEENQRRAS
ncbi:MAG: tRNA (guanosine(46)-N7)-methyltransferase TrmB [Bacteroidetes bacterium]|nr:tRNA (guanosine(46)-N7)-methyltransferase TrmB [Bacteroidota bacterium]